MNCPKCNKPMMLFVSIRLNLPAKYTHEINKSVIRKKECKITSADWNKAYVYCKDCNYRNKDL